MKYQNLTFKMQVAPIKIRFFTKYKIQLNNRVVSTPFSADTIDFRAAGISLSLLLFYYLLCITLVFAIIDMNKSSSSILIQSKVLTSLSKITQ